MLESLRYRINAVLALGPANVARVLWYRIRLRMGVHPVQRIPVPALAPGPFFSAPAELTTLATSQEWRDSGEYFGWFRPPLHGVPAWHENVFTGGASSSQRAPWWTIPDFDPGVGDIKTVWEASRFDWALAAASRAKGGDAQAVQQLNDWLADWCRANPAYLGANWKCGQEASIRVMHLAIAAVVLDAIDEPTAALLSLVSAHCARIAPTIGYAIGQDNNHGTSEAAALFIGGTWLHRHGAADGSAFAAQGRGLLENRVQRLVAADGSFSQYSLNYHRLLLDTLSVVELWRQRMAAPRFAEIVYARAAAAARWLHTFVDPATGDAPNLGANDGANLLPLTAVGYRDYRPAVQLAAALFLGRNAYPSHRECGDHLAWLGVPQPSETLDAPQSRLFDDGGYGVLVGHGATALLRYPRFRFRPGHTDALHVDLRVGEVNILRDGGSYSYNAGAEWSEYFTGARGQNSIQFDDREQMPKVGRFLWGEWLQTASRSTVRTATSEQGLSAAYVDWKGGRHERDIALGEYSLAVVDNVSGFQTRAILRWRLRPGAWHLDGVTLTDGKVRITVSADVPIRRLELVHGWESRLYLQKDEIPVLEAEISEPGTLRTHVQWTP